MVKLVDERLDGVVDFAVVDQEAGFGVDLAGDFNEDDVAVTVKIVAGMMRREMVEPMGGVEVELVGEGDDHEFLVACREHTPSRLDKSRRATPLERGTLLGPRFRGED